MRRLCNSPWLWLALIVLALAVQTKPWFELTSDAAAYVSIAGNFAQGKVERLGDPHLYYAPGYPALLSPVFRLAGDSALGFSLFHLLLAVGLVGLLVRWFTLNLRDSDESAVRLPPIAVLLTALVVLNIGFLDLYRKPLSELAFMVWLVAGALALNAALTAPRVRIAMLMGFLGAMVVAAAAVTRQAGVTLAAGFGLCVLVLTLRKQVRWLAAITGTLGVAIPAAVAVAALTAWDGQRAQVSLDRHPVTDVAYHEEMLEDQAPLLSRLGDGLRRRISDTGRLVIPGMYKSYSRSGTWLHVTTLPYLAVALLVAWGWWLQMRDRPDVLVATLPFYVMLYVLWGHGQGGRFMVPMLPILVLCLWRVAHGLGDRRLPVFVVLVGLHVVTSAIYGVKWTEESLEAAREFAAIEPVVEEADEPGADWAVFAVPDDIRLQLVHHLDRPAEAHPALAEMPAETDLVLAGPEAETDADGWEVRLVERGWKVLGRSPSDLSRTAH